MVGIDPGTHTGYAEYCREAKRLIAVRTLMIHEAFDAVRLLKAMDQLHSVTFEDARLRKWLGSKGPEALQGAGSIKRDCSAWADFLADLGVPYRTVAPQKGLTKWEADHFKRVTGWEARTSEHARDAAMLVWGK